MPHKLHFRVVNATSQDDYHRAIEISNHTPASKGWHSANFCLYPQDIVISLEHRCHIKKIQLLSHQYLIATKVEFYVGDCPNDTVISINNARFTRLGYVSLSDNEKTQFKARELKSVHVDAMGRFIKLVIHTNFINKHNHYNQVGIIAINVIGDEVYHQYNENDNSNPYKSDHILPSEDLAFDMSIDPETAQIIRNLEKIKIQAVDDEQYDRAKKIRDMISYLKEVGEKLGKLEIEKRSASESENYDRAKMKKQQIDEYRNRVYNELDLQDFFNIPRIVPKPIEKPMAEIDMYSHRGSNQNNNALIIEEPKVYNYIEDRPLPALKNQKNEVSPRKNDFKEPIFTSPTEDIEIIHEEADDGVIPGMSKSDLSEANDAIMVYGLPLVSRVYSKNWSHREDALLEVQRRLTEIPSDADKEDIKSEIRGASCLVKKAFKSRITQVVKLAMDINSSILLKLIDKLAIQKPEVHHYLDKIVPEIFRCIEDNKIQIKEMTFPYLIDMSQWEHVKQFPTVFSEAVKPLSPNILVRPGQVKSEMLLELYSIHGLTNHYFTLDNFMKYAIQALQHKSAELRESAETLIVVLYRNEDKQTVRSYLPPDDMQTRKNVLYKRLFEKLDKIDGVLYNTNNRVIDQESSRRKEMEVLQIEQQKLKDQLKVKPVGQVSKKPAVKANPQKEPQSGRISNQFKSSELTNPQSKTAKINSQDDLLADLDKTCIFCGEVNEALKDNMDLHYWKNCPILRRCPHCKQAVEISSLTQHFLQECEQKSQFVQCSRCTEAILKSDDKHFTDVLCNPADLRNSIRCPLCHENIPFDVNMDSPEQLWQFHLMDVNKGCVQNPRRLIAIQRKNQEKYLNNKNNNFTSNKPISNSNRKSYLPLAKAK